MSTHNSGAACCLYLQEVDQMSNWPVVIEVTYVYGFFIFFSKTSYGLK